MMEIARLTDIITITVGILSVSNRKQVFCYIFGMRKLITDCGGMDIIFLINFNKRILKEYFIFNTI